MSSDEHHSRIPRSPLVGFGVAGVAIVGVGWVSGILPWAISPAASDPCMASGSDAIVASCPSTAPVLAILVLLGLWTVLGATLDVVISRG